MAIAINDHVLLKIYGPKSKTAGGIILTEGTRKAQATAGGIGRVVSIGIEAQERAQKNDVSVGDFVSFTKYGGIEVEQGGEIFRGIYFEDIVAKVDKDKVLEKNEEVVND